jgi:hypothetical protein
MFSDKDLKQLKSKGLTVNQIESQIDIFKTGLQYIDLIRPALLGDGIKALSDDSIQTAIDLFDSKSKEYKLTKFVPASGAATRMFKELYEFMNNYTGSEEDYLKYLSNRSSESIFYFFEHLYYFAFYYDLKDLIDEKYQLDIAKLLEKNEFPLILEALITEKGLNYGKMPKGLIKFHNYRDFSRTAVEEHMIEARHYAMDKDSVVKLHFTVPDDYMKEFKAHVAEVAHYHKEKYNTKFEINFSVQDPTTDTIAVDKENQPLRDEKGKIIFRPGGHGSLIKNLNQIQEDIVFIKNIDNIVPDRLKPESVKYKKVIGGLLLKYQEAIFKFLNQMDQPEITDPQLAKIQKFIENDLCFVPNLTVAELSKSERIELFKSILNRPIRVCGMVINEGEPGGGPFFVKQSNGVISLQIVESSQMDINDAKVKKIIQKSSHFNPVDLVCSLKNYKGQKFDLAEFIDPDTAFISIKSKDGKEIKALEWPGLWNGAMSNWNTFFVEVPAVIFNPVKTVNDLLREEHITLAFLQNRPR